MEPTTLAAIAAAFGAATANHRGPAVQRVRGAVVRALLAALAFALVGCGGLTDQVSGSATLSNGTINGTVQVQTPFGPLTYGTLPSPSPSPAGSPQ